MLLTGLNSYSQNCKPDSLINYNYVLGTLVKNKTTRVVYHYSSNGKTEMENLYLWNDSAGSWLNWRINENTFDANGRRIQEIQKYWDGTNWIDQFRNSFQYNATGSMSQLLQQIYNNNVWTNNYKIDVAFNSANDTLQEVRQDWNNGFWVNDYRIDYTYHLDTLVETSLMSWNVNTWMNVWKEEYGYNTLNLVDKSTYSKIVNGNYAFAWSHTYFYDASKRLIQTVRHEWDFTNTDWKPDYRYDYTYDNAGCQESSTTSRSQMPGAVGPFDPYYKTEYFVSGVAGVANTENELRISCYPVPASNHLTITAEDAFTENEFAVVNLLGEHMPLSLSNNTPTSKTINVQQYPKGVYLLHVKNTTIRFVKE